MEVGKLNVEIRSLQGKNEARRLRATGKVPGIIYGKGITPILISVEPKALRKSLDPKRKQNTVIQLTGAGSQTMTVMVKDYQYDRLRTDIEHVDLIAIEPSQDVRVRVPLILTGKPQGVVDGGQLTIAHRSLPVVCKPGDIPVEIIADITSLGLGDALHVSDLKLPAGVRPAMDAGEGLASIVAPRAEKETKVEETAEAAPAAAAAPAAGAKGAAPAAAAGDKKAAAPAAEKGAKK
jgi:large subunit ribosomal protein L25